MSLSSYLHKRPNSQRWQLRMMIPKSARPAIGRSEFTRSLGVTDRRQAENAAYPILAEWKATIAAAAGAKSIPTPLESAHYVPSAIELEEVALLTAYEEAGLRLETLIRSKARLGDAAFQALAPEFERRHSDALRRYHANDHTYWKGIAQRVVSKRAWHLTDDSAEFDGFVQSIAQCGIDLFASARSRIEGRGSDFAPSPYVRAAIERRVNRAKAGEGLLDLFDRYKDQRLSEGRKKVDTLIQDRKVILLFADYVDTERALSSIEKREIREWRNALTNLPSAFKKRKDFIGLSMRQAVDKAKLTNERGISLVTVNKYLSAVSALFVWAQREGYVESNPCEGLFYDADKRKNPRPPFDADQLNTIIGSPLFSGFAADGREYERGERKADDWRYWIPLICLFTGARIGEIAQLRLSDIRNEDGEWFFVIANDEGAGLSTKNKQTRIAPMHSMLRSIGLLDFVRRRENRYDGSRGSALFPELSRNERGHAGKPSRFWRNYLSHIGVKKGADGFGSHSFRHALADQLRSAGCFDNEVAVAIGHKQTSVTSGYGRIRQGSAKKLNQMIEGARFDGVDFSKLFVSADLIHE